MQLQYIEITNSGSEDEIILGLPDGGVVPAGEAKEFLISTNNMPMIQRELRPKQATLTVTSLRAATGDRAGPFVAMSQQVLCRQFQLRHSDFTTVDVSQVIADTFTFPERAVGLGVPIVVLEEVFAGGTVGSAVLDVGLVTGNADAYLDGCDVFTGATLGEILPLATLDAKGIRLLAGDKLEITLVTGGGNVNTCTTGRFIVYQLYTVLPAPAAA